MPLAAFNFSRWIDEHAHLLKPPVGNQLVFREAVFFQLRGDMVLKGIGCGRPVDIPICEGEILLIPGHFRYSPQRSADSVGLVVEKFYSGTRECPRCGHIHPGRR